MTNEEMNTAHYQRMHEKQMNFKNELMTMSPSEILNHAYEDNTVRPESYITRAEFAAMVSRLAYGNPGKSQFHDVASDHWAMGVIASVAGYGWVNSYEDGAFWPESYITRAEACTIINRMLGRAVDQSWVTANRSSLRQFDDLRTSEWYYYQMVEAINSHAYTRTNEQETWTGLR